MKRSKALKQTWNRSHIPQFVPSSSSKLESATQINANNFIEGVKSAKVNTEEVDIKLAECSYIPQQNLVLSKAAEHVAQVNAPAEDTAITSNSNIFGIT